MAERLTVKHEVGGHYPKISFDDKETLSAAIRDKRSFQVTAIKSRQRVAVKWLQSEIEEQGMTCRTYTNKRWIATAPVVAIPGIGPWIAGVAAVKYAAENIRSPDFEVRRGLVWDFVEVTYRKQE